MEHSIDDIVPEGLVYVETYGRNGKTFEQHLAIVNIIYNELIRRGYSVDVGVVEDRRGSEKKLKESSKDGAKHYGLDTGTIVSENVRNGYCTYGFRRI